MQSQPHKQKTGSKRLARPFLSERNKQTRALIRAQRKARRHTPGLRDMLAAWDAVQDAARVRLDAHNAAYRDAKLTGTDPSCDPTPTWQAVIDGLTESL